MNQTEINAAVATHTPIEEHHIANTRPISNVVATMDQFEAARDAARAVLVEAESQLIEAKTREQGAAAARVQAEINRFYITKDMLTFPTPPSVPMYLNPLTGEKWSGKGNAPRWAKDQPLEQFLNPAWVAKNQDKAA